MTEEEERLSVQEYLKRYELQIRKQLTVLEHTIHMLTGFKPFWNGVEQQYTFQAPGGVSRVKPWIGPRARNRLYGWFGNENNKGKKWPATRRARKAA
jgi:hypothetical protein